MKEQTLIEMKNKIEATTRVVQHMLHEITHLRELSVGTLETIKKMPDYDTAIEALKAEMEEQVKEKEKATKNGTSE
jgi:hypothetical protein